MADYTTHLERKLHSLDAEIDRLQAHYEQSDIDEKARVLGELNQLRVLHDDLAERVEAARKKGSDNWSALHTSFQEEADALHDTFEKWLTKLG